MIKIDSDVPAPVIRQEYSKFPFADMQLGDSFFLANADPMLTHRVQTQVSYQKRKAAGSKLFTTRRQDGGIRVWRIK